MDGGFQFFDIILFALIAAFLVLRLRGVLGRRDGFQGRPRDPFGLQRDRGNDNDAVVPLPDRRNAPETDAPTAAEASTPLAAGLAQVQRVDPSFDAEEFLVGARTAFEMIITAYNQGDTAALEPLLSRDVYENFKEAMTGRERRGETLEASLVALKSADIVEAYVDGRTAHVTVKFVSEQVNATRGASGDIVDGDPNTITTVTDFWTFARDTRARDPNWTLVATGTSD